MERQVFTLWLVFSSQIVLADLAVHQNAIEIYSLHVDCKVTSRFAHTVITSRVVNKANESKEALFEVELPKTAFITNFSMTIDGETYPGIIKEKKSAQDQYDAAVSRGQSAGLVKSAGRKLEQFHVSVNVAAAAKVTFELIYEELLKRKLGKYELLIKVKPKQLVNHFQIDTHIFEPQGISFLETESTFMTNELSNALTKVQDETKAHISFKPTISQQRKSPELEETLLNGDFLIRYDVKRSVAAGDIQIVNGYFVHYFAPSQMPAFPKNIIFVIDKSGSMSGKKIQQTIEALQKILGDLNPEDHFNLVIFSGNVAEWRPSLLQATEENVELAKQYVQTIFAQGVTDINGALLAAIRSLDKATSAELLPDRSVSMIILLTDGQPTTGVTNVNEIQANIKRANEGKYFLYCLGFGFDVSYSFLEKMALDNGGVARRIYEDSDAALQLQGFYHEVATPILKEIEMKYPDNVALEITQNNFKLLFDGSEIVVAGKLGNEIDVFPVEINAQSHTSNLTLKEEANVSEKEQVFQHQEYIFGNFIERLWAYQTIQQLLEKSVSAEGEKRKNLDAQALNLSLKFSFVTPLTSMVVTKPDAQEVANKPTEADNENFRQQHRVVSRVISGRQGHPASRRKESHYGSRFLSIPVQSFIRRDKYVPNTYSSSDYPHFILQVPGDNASICLNINGQSQTTINLLSDPDKGIIVTGKRGENRQFVEFEVIYQMLNMQISVSTREIVLNDQSYARSFPWTNAASLTVKGLRIIIEQEESLSLSGPGNITMKVYYKKPPLDFLALYFQNSDNFSDKVAGLLGQFFFNTQFERSHGENVGRKKILVQGQPHDATRQSKKDYRTGLGGGTMTCWSLSIIH
ncbi:inter-alpha-trypsin inhibitor heavy chain H4-like isoform X2 [Elgaria multicarinata webbii]|uniref:inter-alpha-trypsin inhibitor heavy chain H4-like isoform X2 n=1 Tax=Elgaria multicarinata webbii TaxID=159646 RepID=UPI002FCD0E54